MERIAIIDQIGCKAGMDIYSYSLAKGLNNKGNKISIYSNFSFNDEKIPILNYFRIAQSGFLKKMEYLIWGYLKSFIDAKRKHYDFLILNVFTYSAFDLFSFIIARIFRFKSIAILHDIEPFNSEKGSSNFIRELIINYLANSVVVHNSYSLDILKKTIELRKNKIIQIINAGAYTDLNSEFFHHNEIKPIELAEVPNYLLFFGQIKSEKGLDVLLNAMSLVNKNYKLIVAGRFKDNELICRNIIKVKDLNESVILINRFISDEEKEYLFKNAEAIIIPYKKIYNSGVLLDSISYKKMIIASDLPPVREIVTDKKTGFLFNSEDPIDLAKKINYLISLEESEKKQIKENAYQVAKADFSWDLVSEKYIELINKLNK